MVVSFNFLKPEFVFLQESTYCKDLFKQIHFFYFIESLIFSGLNSLIKILFFRREVGFKPSRHCSDKISDEVAV